MMQGAEAAAAVRRGRGSGGLVVPGGVDGEVAQYFSGGGVDGGEVVVVGQDQDAGSVVVAADSDVVQATVDAQGD